MHLEPTLPRVAQVEQRVAQPRAERFEVGGARVPRREPHARRSARAARLDERAPYVSREVPAEDGGLCVRTRSCGEFGSGAGAAAGGGGASPAAQVDELGAAGGGGHESQRSAAGL